MSGRSHAWMLLLAMLAYIALTFHASFALASMTQAMPPAAHSGHGDVATNLHAGQSPLAPCCGEQQCTNLVTIGLLAPTAHKAVAKTRFKAQAATVQFRAPSSTPLPETPVPARNRRPFQQSPIYLSTARLRL
ncbi:MAG TPA: hypothetical protein VFA48_06865 [Gammaproteobacteria bacterium]|nr:hypothetical protein [Gammaproteobacteria bacterium]